MFRDLGRVWGGIYALGLVAASTRTALWGKGWNLRLGVAFALLGLGVAFNTFGVRGDINAICVRGRVHEVRVWI